MRRYLLGLAATAVALTAGCVSDPTGDLAGTPARIITSLSQGTVRVGDSILVTAQLRDAQNVTLAIQPEVSSQTPAVLSVSTVNAAPVPELRFYVKGLAFGLGTVAVSYGSLDPVEISVQAAAATIGILGVPETMRSGETATVSLTGLDVDGNPVAGVGPLTLESDNEAVLDLDTTTMTVTAIQAGSAVLSASGPQDAEGELTVAVVPGVAASAAFGAATFGAIPAAGTSTLELLVLDAAGNQNTNIPEVLSVIVNSSNTGVASVAAVVEDTAGGGTERHIFVTATGVAGGKSSISGSVTTSEGVLAVPAVQVTVLAPQITASAPSSAAGSIITINGAGLADPDFVTAVLVDGAPVGNVTSASATQVTAQMPTLLAGTYDLEVSVGGVVSNTDSWTQTANFDEAATEPNDAQGQEAPISASFKFSGAADFDTDYFELFQFTVSEDNVVIALELAFGGAGSDFDALIYPKGAQDPGTYSEDTCGFALSTGASPEKGDCTLGAAGTYVLEIVWYAGAGTTTWTATGTIKN